jgi:uncharacterized protein (TIGR03437 family)
MSWWRIYLGLFLASIPAAAQSVPALAVDAGANQHPISPYIYGINDYGDNGLGNIVRVGVRRWGGDATLRYNYLIDTWNSAADYYFENAAQTSTGPLPDGSLFDLFVNNALLDGSLRVGTIPILDWLPKDRNFECSYNVALYGAQKMMDPYNTECGDGETPAGSPIMDTDLTVDGQPNNTMFAQGWIDYLIGRYGSANRGGVQVWSLGNEPDWWYSVHQDIHPMTATYDEILSRGQMYAAAIKQADPDALVTGQVAAGWSGMFYSSTDFVSGWSTPPYMFYDNPVDQNAHGGIGLTEWYLQRMQAYEKQHGQRLLDYVDVHAYIAPNDISFTNNAGDPTIDTLRLTSTREFWDPNYVPPPGPGATVSPTPSPAYPNGEPPYLVPRMLQWVATNYPGTKTAITEYNWGALNDITGAIAQADLLGIFGREGLDLATIWSPPNPNPGAGAPPDPGVFAFKMYLNYDGNGSQFGETSVSATTGNPDELSIFAAQRSDNALTVMVLNKMTSSATAPVSVANFQTAGNAQVWQYGAADLTAIQHLSDLNVSGGSVTAAFPARSITLLVLPALPSSLPATKPAIAAVTNAASYASQSVSPGEFVVIFGTNLGPKVLAGAQLTADGEFLTQSTGNVRVLFNGFVAPMVYSSAGQVSAVVPYEVALAANAAVQVEVQGVRSDPFMIPVAAAVPAIFTASSTGKGQGSILNQDASVNSSTNPAASGQVIVIYATGEGQTSPPGVDGRIQFDVKSVPMGACAVTIGGQSAAVNYCGMSPYEASGVLQINAVVPSNAGTGNVPVSFSIGGVSSPVGVTVALK